jgi:putative ABC transport system permease protein
LFVAAVTVVVTMILTVAPLVAIGRIRAADALRSSSRGATGDRWNHRVRNGMVVAEIAAAVVLLLATIVLIQSLVRLRDVHLGFSPDRVFLAHVSIPPAYQSPDDVARFYEHLSSQLGAVPGVNQVGVISIAPLSGLLATVSFSDADRPFPERDRPSANYRVMSPGYPMAVGMRVVNGRSFSEDDRANSPRVALVSAALADRFMAGNAVGRRLLINDNNGGPRPVEIVGIVENVREVGLDLPPALHIYIPLRQMHPDTLAFVRNSQFWVISTNSDPSAFRRTFLTQLRAVDPDAAVSATGPMRQYLEAWLGPRRFNLGLFGTFALTAVVLAVSGVYGLVSYAVSQRRTEIGLRMAIGATERDVRWMILRQAVALGMAGAAVGLVLTAAGRPLIASLTQDVWINPIIVAATATAVIGVVLIAAWLPARRAAMIAPALALKAQ